MAKFDVAQFSARSDNFGVLLHDPQSGATAAIDAPDADAIIKELQARGWRLSHIFVTHKHFDHIEGIPALKAAYDCEVIGPAKSAAETGMYGSTVADGDRFDWAGAEIRVIETPGHTLDHVSYFAARRKSRLRRRHDLLARLRAGDRGQPRHDVGFAEAPARAPRRDELYCGHEYTLANAKFAVTVDPANAALRERMAEVEKLRAAGKPTLPTTIGREKATNPFLRSDDPAVMDAVGMAGADPAQVFAEIRKRKDRF